MAAGDVTQKRNAGFCLERPVLRVGRPLITAIPDRSICGYCNVKLVLPLALRHRLWWPEQNINGAWGGAPEEEVANGETSRYFCPFPGCKRSFAELWRLKVHYRAPPDIRGSGKERGHGTELTHCPKCGKGLKPGKHHVGCSGGKAAPRQAKRQRQAAAANTMAAQNGMNDDAQAMYGNCMVMPGAYGQGMPAGMPPNGYGAAYGQQYAPYPQQQYQPDMSGAYYQGQPHPMAGGVMQQQPQMQQQQGIQSPTLGLGLGQDQLNSTGSAVLQGGSGEMLMGNPQGYQQYQQQAMPLQQQPLMQMQQPQEQQELLQTHHEMMQAQQPMMDMLDSSHLQQPQQQQVMMQQPQIKQEPVSMGMPHTVTTASGAYLAQQQQQQQPMQHQQMLLPQDQSYLVHDPATSALMPPPPPVQMGHMQQQPMLQQPSEAVQQQVQLVQQQPQQQQPQQMLPPAQVQVQPPRPAPSQLQPAALGGQISSSVFDEIDNMSAAGAGAASSSSGAAAQPENTRAPSPPPLPADFPQASGMGTLFNFSQFSQKLPAAQGPSQQMAMMPRGMEQELPPSMDDLWTPEATYDHHSDGDLMQLLFGAPEQPPTMATIHLHHFLEDDACSSPLLTGLIGGSMDDLRAAEAKAGDGAAGVANINAHAVAAPIHAQPAAPVPAAVAAAVAVTPADSKPMVHASTAGVMLPPAAMPLEPLQQHGCQPQYQYQHIPQQQQGMLAPKLEPQQQQLQPGVNGVIHSQCGASATIQVQEHMQMHGGDATASTAAGMVQIKGEDGCMLQKAVPSMPGAVASRAT